MGNDLLSSLLPTLILFATTISSTPSATLQAPKTSSVQENVYHVVKTGESLGTIAQAEYGSSDFWTTLWNDNDWIKNSDLVEADWKLKIRIKKPTKPEALSKNLVKVTPIPVRTVQPAPAVHAAATAQNMTKASSPTILNETQMTFLGTCESGMTPTRNSGNGYYGAFQFSPATWRSMGTGYERADIAPLDVQKDAVQRLLARSSIHTQFPGCSHKMQLAGLL